MAEFVLDDNGNPIPHGKEPKMRVKVMRSFGLGGGREAAVGDVVDLPEAVARQWIRTGRLAPVLEAAIPEPDDLDPDAPDYRDPEPPGGHDSAKEE